MQKKDVFDQFRRFLSETEGEFHILEHQVPIETQMEYFKYSNRLRNFILPAKLELTADESDYEQLVAELRNQETAKESKQRILSLLAVSKQVKAYRILENYLKSPDEDLTDWAHMALMECRIRLEIELSDEKFIYISTGLGGKGNKLRFYVLLLSAYGNPFLEYQQQIVEQELAYILSKEEGEIEQLFVKGNYMEILVLVPIQTNIKKVFEHLIDECNQYGNFISDTVTVTNVKRLTDAEIAEIIKKYENKNNRTSI